MEQDELWSLSRAPFPQKKSRWLREKMGGGGGFFAARAALTGWLSMYGRHLVLVRAAAVLSTREEETENCQTSQQTVHTELAFATCQLWSPANFAR